MKTKKKFPALFILWAVLFFNCQDSSYVKYLQPVNNDVNPFDYYQTSLDYFNYSKLDSSLFFINKAIVLNSNYAPFYYLKGKIFLFEEVNDSALVNFEKALELKSFYPEIWQDISSLYFSAKQYEKALSYYDKLIEFSPQKEQYEYYAAVCKNHLGQYEVAARQLEDLKNRGLYFNGLYYQLAFSYLHAGDLEKSNHYFNRYLRMQNKSPRAEELLTGIKIFELLGDDEKALSIANKGLQSYPEMVEWRYVRVKYFSRKGNKKALQYELESIERIAKQNGKATLFLIKFYSENGERDRALKVLKVLDDFNGFDTNELEEFMNYVNDKEILKKILSSLYEKTGNKKYKKRLKNL